MSRPLLSAALIVKDEETVLERCLESLRPVADEIVVVDTGSTDRTPEIARATGAVLVRSPWRDDFAAARNVALHFARGRWVLSLDADEALEVDAARLRQTLELAEESAFYVTLWNAFPDPTGHVGWEQLEIVRLFRKRPGVIWEGRIHEQILPSVVRVGGRVGRLPWAVIRHWGYLPEEMARKRSKERNRRLFEEVGGQLSPYLLYQKGVQDLNDGRTAEGRRNLTLALARGLEQDWAARAAYLAARAAEGIGDTRSAVALLRWAEKRWPAFTDLWLLEAEVEARRGNYLQAASLFTQCLARGDADVPWEHLRGAGSFIALTQLGETFLAMGDPADAVPILERALQIEPGYPAAERAYAQARRLLSAQAAS